VAEGFPVIVSFVLMGALGGIAYVLVMKVWGEPAEAIRRIALGTIVGLLTYLSGLTNHLTA